MLENSVDKLIANRIVRIVMHVLFFAFGVAYTLNSIVKESFLKYFKVLPLVLLIILILPTERNNCVVKVILGIISGMVGDILLDYFHGSLYFSIGIGFFLLGHIFYNLSIFDLWETKIEYYILKRKYLILFSSALFLSISFINLATTISDKMRNENFMMLILTPIYLIFLTINCINSFLLLIADKTINRYQLGLWIGTIMFLISDNLLGRSIFSDFKILGDRKFNSVIIMITYYLGQYFIVMSFSELVIQSDQNIRSKLTMSLVTQSSMN